MRSHTISKVISLWAVCSLTFLPAVGQQTQSRDGQGDRPTMTAVRIVESPVVDGQVIGEPVWDSIQATTDFWQNQPDEGEPASQRTEIRVGYTNDTLYISAVCYDRDPGQIIISDSRRDASLDATDSFRFILDTYTDGQNGFVFGTNPAGIEFDAQVTNEGQGGSAQMRMMRGSGAGFNINWDGSWEVRTSTSDIGWSAEFAIPFKTLRFPRADVQSWGVNFQRTIPRRKENAYWAMLPLQFDLNRVSLAGTVSGIEVPSPRNLKIMPYALGGALTNFDVDNRFTDQTKDFGVDLKYSITPSLTLDASYNTDFAQVEVDEEQVNLDRFTLFFPEKRPFFLENAGLFSVGESGEAELFFSRRIGISEDGESVPILGGARVSGNVGKMKVGLLEMQTETVGEDIQANNFAVARVQREFQNRSAIGVLLTSRQGTGDLAPSNDYNRVLAIDGRLGLGPNAQLTGFVARSFTPGMDGNPMAIRLAGAVDTEAWTVNGGYTEAAEDFNPELGYLRRNDYRKMDVRILHRYRPDDFLSLQELRPHMNYNGYWGRDGFHETGFLHIDNHWEFKSAWEVHTGVNFRKEGVREVFEVADGVEVPADTYNYSEVQIVMMTDRSDWISASMRTTIGGFFGGDRISTGPTVQVRRGDQLTTQFSWSYNTVDLPGGSFTTNLFRGRVSYSFTPRIFLQVLAQYNDQADLWSANVRFGWLREANTGLFVVYNQTNQIDGWPGEPMNRGLTLKYTHLFDVFE